MTGPGSSAGNSKRPSASVSTSCALPWPRPHLSEHGGDLGAGDRGRIGAADHHARDRAAGLDDEIALQDRVLDLRTARLVARRIPLGDDAEAIPGAQLQRVQLVAAALVRDGDFTLEGVAHAEAAAIVAECDDLRTRNGLALVVLHRPARSRTRTENDGQHVGAAALVDEHVGLVLGRVSALASHEAVGPVLQRREREVAVVVRRHLVERNRHVGALGSEGEDHALAHHVATDLVHGDRRAGQGLAGRADHAAAQDDPLTEHDVAQVGRALHVHVHVADLDGGEALTFDPNAEPSGGAHLGERDHTVGTARRISDLCSGATVQRDRLVDDRCGAVHEQEAHGDRANVPVAVERRESRPLAVGAVGGLRRRAFQQRSVAGGIVLFGAVGAERDDARGEEPGRDGRCQEGDEDQVRATGHAGSPRGWAAVVPPTRAVPCDVQDTVSSFLHGREGREVPR